MSLLTTSRGNWGGRLLLVAVTLFLVLSPATAGASTLVAGADHSNEDHSGENHSGEDLTSIILSGADLSVANLKNSIFITAIILAGDLSGSNLQGTDFTGATLDGSNFNGTNIKNSDFSGASLAGVDFRAVNWTGAVFTGATYDDSTLFTPGFDLSSLIRTPEPSPGLMVAIGLLGLSVHSRRAARFQRMKTN